MNLLKNRLDDDDYQKLLSSKVNSSEKTQNNPEVEGYQIIQKLSIENWNHNEGKDKHSYEYSREIYQFSHMMKSYSGKMYDLVYKAFYLPHPSSVDTYFSKDLINKKEEIIDKTKMEKNTMNYKNKNTLGDQKIDICLSVDACSFDRIANKTKKYVFVYCMQPLSPSLKCVPIYFQPENNRKAKDTIIKTALEIATLLNENFYVIAISAEGDNVYDKKAREIFDIYCSVIILHILS